MPKEVSREGFPVSARILILVTGLFWLSQYAFTPYINRELARMGMDEGFMGLVAGGYGFSQMLLRIPLGIWSDRIGRKKPFVLAGCLMLVLSAAGFLLFYTPGGFLVARTLGGVASASWVSFTVLYSAYFPREEGPRRVTQLNVPNITGRLVGYGLTALLLTMFDVRASFALSLVCGVLALLLALGIKEEPMQREATGLREIIQVAKGRYLLVTSFISILTQWVAFSTYYTFTANVAMALGAGEQELTLLQIALLVPNILSNALVDRPFIRKIGANILVGAGFVFGALYCLLVPLAPNLPVLYALQTLGGITSTLTFAVLLGQCVRDTAPAKRSVAMGFYQAVYGIGMTLGPVVMGQMINGAGLKNAFFMVAGISLVAALLAYKMMKIK